MKLTKKLLRSLGWEEHSGVMVRFSQPRVGWKEDGTLIIGWNEYPEKVTEIETLIRILNESCNSSQD